MAPAFHTKAMPVQQRLRILTQEAMPLDNDNIEPAILKPDAEKRNLTLAERRYQKRIDGVEQIVAETTFTNEIQSQIDQGNKHILKNFKLRLLMEPSEG
jgi:hypothetical protein